MKVKQMRELLAGLDDADEITITVLDDGADFDLEVVGDRDDDPAALYASLAYDGTKPLGFKAAFLRTRRRDPGPSVEKARRVIDELNMARIELPGDLFVVRGEALRAVRDALKK